METNPTLCLICSKEKATPVTVPENFDFLKLLCKTLNFPTIVPLLTELRIPIPNSLFCVDCSDVIRASRDVLNKISILEEELERLRQQLKKCIVSSGSENWGRIERERKELNTGPFIRKLFVQCWSNCSVDVVRIPVHAGIETGIPESDPSESLSRTWRRGRPRKMCTDTGVALGGETVETEEDLERRSKTSDDVETFDPNEFLVISEEDPDAEEELEFDTSEEYSMKKFEKVKSKRRRKIKAREDPEHGGVRRKRGRKDGEDLIATGVLVEDDEEVGGEQEHLKPDSTAGFSRETQPEVVVDAGAPVARASGEGEADEQPHWATLETGVYCGRCRRSFRDRKSKWRHIKTAHEAFKMPCSECKVVFTRRDNLLRHLRSVHDLTHGLDKTLENKPRKPEPTALLRATT